MGIIASARSSAGPVSGRCVVGAVPVVGCDVGAGETEGRGDGDDEGRGDADGLVDWPTDGLELGLGDGDVATGALPRCCTK